MGWHQLLPLSVLVLVFACGDSQSKNKPQTSNDCDSSRSLPQNVSQLVSQLNALPKPVTLPCFLQSLSDGFRISASDSDLSAQPAGGRDNPRFFVATSDNLVFTVVAAGRHSQQIEIAESVDALNSIKAEIDFPIAEELTPGAPYEGLFSKSSSHSCSHLCHSNFEEWKDYDGVMAFSSTKLRPNPASVLSVGEIEALFSVCATN